MVFEQQRSPRQNISETVTDTCTQSGCQPRRFKTTRLKIESKQNEVMLQKCFADQTTVTPARIYVWHMQIMVLMFCSVTRLRVRARGRCLLAWQQRMLGRHRHMHAHEVCKPLWHKVSSARDTRLPRPSKKLCVPEIALQAQS